MHEASIAMNLLETVVEHCRRDGYAAVESIRIKVGQGANILPDALSFAFDIAKQGTLAAEAVLIIEAAPFTARCDHCGRQAAIENRLALDCPQCGGLLTIVSGYELDLIDMEVTENPPV